VEGKKVSFPYYWYSNASLSKWSFQGYHPRPNRLGDHAARKGLRRWEGGPETLPQTSAEVQTAGRITVLSETGTMSGLRQGETPDHGGARPQSGGRNPNCTRIHPPSRGIGDHSNRDQGSSSRQKKCPAKNDVEFGVVDDGAGPGPKEERRKKGRVRALDAGKNAASTKNLVGGKDCCRSKDSRRRSLHL